MVTISSLLVFQVVSIYVEATIDDGQQHTRYFHERVIERFVDIDLQNIRLDHTREKKRKNYLGEMQVYISMNNCI